MFFRTFPKINYTFQNGKTIQLSDIFRRVSITQKTLLDERLFDKYFITDGSSPERVAYKYYFNPNYSWFLFLSNQIVNPHTDWPMDYTTFNTYLENKYKGSSFFTYDLPDLRPGDIMVASNGSTIDQSKYATVTKWDSTVRNIVVFGGQGTFSSNDTVIFVRNIGDSFEQVSNLITLKNKVTQNLDIVKYFYQGSEIISPYRIVNASGVLTSVTADSTSTSIEDTGDYEDTSTIRYTLLYRYINNQTIPALVKTVRQYENDLEYEKYSIKVPRQEIISTLFELYKRAAKSDTIGRSVQIDINI